jgi:hypothetical protein
VADRVSSPAPATSIVPRRFWAWIDSPRCLAALVWIVAAVCGVAVTYRSLHWFDSPATLSPERKRADGNSGHAQIDFGGQWLMGRMIVTGNGRELYHRQKQWEVLRAGYSEEDESPLQREAGSLPRSVQTGVRSDEDYQHDATNFMTWFMGGGNDARGEWKKLASAVAVPLAQPPTGHPIAAVALEKAAADAVTPDLAAKIEKPSIGGPLYPPVHAIFYVPVGLFDRPRLAYQVFQVLSAFLIPLAALGVNVLTRGRIWWSVATLLLFLYPGTRGALDLGQNPTVSLCIVVWGWVLASRGYNVAGGMVWGLFAFKPVWAAAFFLVPLLMRRWRFCCAMVLTGAAFGALTLPFVGLESWFEWLKIGQEASELYKVNDNWIHLSRDLQGIPRRALIDFTKPEEERDTPTITNLAWGLWGAVFATTVVIYLLRGDRSKPTGLSAGFLFLGAHLTCFHFMYYDSLLAAAALAVLFADPKKFLRTRAFAINPEPVEPAVPADRVLHAPNSPPKALGPRMLGYVNSFPLTVVLALFVVENSLSGLELEATVGARYFATPATDGSTIPQVPRVKGDTGPRYPLDTFLLLSLWGWCGLRLVRGDEEKRIHHRDTEGTEQSKTEKRI